MHAGDTSDLIQVTADASDPNKIGITVRVEMEKREWSAKIEETITVINHSELIKGV